MRCGSPASGPRSALRATTSKGMPRNSMRATALRYSIQWAIVPGATRSKTSEWERRSRRSGEAILDHLEPIGGAVGVELKIDDPRANSSLMIGARWGRPSFVEGLREPRLKFVRAIRDATPGRRRCRTSASGAGCRAGAGTSSPPRRSSPRTGRLFDRGRSRRAHGPSPRSGA